MVLWNWLNGPCSTQFYSVRQSIGLVTLLIHQNKFVIREGAFKSYSAPIVVALLRRQSPLVDLTANNKDGYPFMHGLGRLIIPWTLTNSLLIKAGGSMRDNLAHHRLLGIIQAVEWKNQRLFQNICQEGMRGSICRSNWPGDNRGKWGTKAWLA